MNGASNKPKITSRWHRLNKPMIWLLLPAAACCWTFGGCHIQIVHLDPFLESREYDLYCFRLLETSGGHWYIRFEW